MLNHVRTNSNYVHSDGANILGKYGSLTNLHSPKVTTKKNVESARMVGNFIDLYNLLLKKPGAETQRVQFKPEIR